LSLAKGACRSAQSPGYRRTALAGGRGRVADGDNRSTAAGLHKHMKTTLGTRAVTIAHLLTPAGLSSAGLAWVGLAVTADTAHGKCGKQRYAWRMHSKSLLTCLPCEAATCDSSPSLVRATIWCSSLGANSCVLSSEDHDRGKGDTTPPKSRFSYVRFCGSGGHSVLSAGCRVLRASSPLCLNSPSSPPQFIGYTFHTPESTHRYESLA
jgi:hypothetical protein